MNTITIVPCTECQAIIRTDSLENLIEKHKKVICEDCFNKNNNMETSPIIVTDTITLSDSLKQEPEKKKHKSKKDLKDIKDELRIKWAIKHKIPHFAPTISPAPKSLVKKEIESLEEAIRYYYGKGIFELIIQPKYMGSYCDIELHKNLEDSRFISRNGYVIDHLDRTKLLNAAKPLHDKLGWIGINKYLIQAELLPWSAMGQHLIENDFKTYGHLIESHVNYLKMSNMHDKIKTIKDSPEYKQYIQEKYSISLKELNSLYSDKHHIKRTYDAVEKFYFMDLKAFDKGINTFNKQLEIYGQSYDEYQFAPFNILKTYGDNGEEFVNDSNIAGFCVFNLKNQNFLILDLSKTNLEEAISQAYNFFNALVAYNYEGVVVKPNAVYIEDVTPMFKVRNKNYLTLIYGANFEVDYEYYLNKRHTRKKETASKNQWKISQYLLRIKDEDLNKENKNYKELIETRIKEEVFEKTLDGRL